jgi:hypothetical protein
MEKRAAEARSVLGDKNLKKTLTASLENSTLK